MKLLIGVLGSSARIFADAHFAQVVQLGNAVAAHQSTLITVAMPGVMHLAAHASHRAGGAVVGISPAWSRADHECRHLPVACYDTLIFAGTGPLRCEHEIIQSADILIVIDAAQGALPTYARTCDERKWIGVLTTPANAGANAVASYTGVNSPTMSDDPEALMTQLMHAFLTGHGEVMETGEHEPACV